MAKKNSTGRPTEDKHKKFRRVVTPRVQKAIKAIKLIGNNATPDYKYTDNDISNIMSVLHATVDGVAKRYATGGTVESDFTLD